MTMVQTPKKHAALPRFATPRSDRPSAIDEARRIAELLGTPLLPWQDQTLEVGLEYELDDDYPGGRNFVYRELAYGTPRQSGKSVITLVKLLHRSVMMGDDQSALYSMQTGSDASRKLLDDWVPIIEDSPLYAAVKRVRRSLGSEGIWFRGRSKIEILRATKSAGHGRTIDEGVIDEAMNDVDDRREQAMVPAMITRPNAQLIITSTAGTEESTFWRRRVDKGRERALAGDTDSAAYFEWSVPDDADVYDHEVWREFMPALGYTQSIAAIKHAAATMDELEFRRAFCNQWTTSGENIIDWEKWVQCRDVHGQIGQDLYFGVDISKDRTSATISAASRRADGSLDLEIIQHDEGVAWLVPRLGELCRRHMPIKVIVEGAGPVGSLIPEMERDMIPVEVLSTQKYAAACGAFHDQIDQVRCHVRQNLDLDEAVANGMKRHRGDQFLWVRQTANANISPLVAATLACWGVHGSTENTALWIK